MLNARGVLVGSVLALAACGGGGGGGGGTGIDPRLARLDIYEAQRLRVLGDVGAGVPGMPLTPDAAVPNAGEAAFAGAAAIQIEQPSGILSLAGDAALTVAFGTATASGAVTDVFGERAGAGIVDYDGSLSLSGVVGGAGFALDYAGSLTAGAEVLTFDGVLSATLLGNPIAGFAALDLAARVDQSGVLRPAALVIFAEGTVTPPAPAP